MRGIWKVGSRPVDGIGSYVARRMRPDLVGSGSFRFWSQRVYLERFARAAASSLPEGGMILDAGAGEGMYRSLFHHGRYESADFMENEHKRYGSMTYVCDLAAIPVEDDRYDLILCTQVLEHVPDPNVVLAELYRVLKPGGFLWLSTPLFYQEHDVPFDFYRYTQYGLRHLVSEAGFTSIEIDWLEGFYGTLSYQFDRMMKQLPCSPRAYGGGVVGGLMAPIAAALRVQFRALWFLFEQLDIRYKYVESGNCINYTVVAEKRLVDVLQRVVGKGE